MTTIRKVPVTLTVEEAEKLATVLNQYASSQWNHARTTKSAAIREFSEQRGAQERAKAIAAIVFGLLCAWILLGWMLS